MRVDNVAGWNAAWVKSLMPTSPGFGSFPMRQGTKAFTLAQPEPIGPMSAARR
jgi:tetrahydromethanopterin S-methyltransferase subunit B